MKDKKFVVLCVLGIVWLFLFVAMLFGAKVHPRVEQLVSILCLGWFAFWTISYIRIKPVQPTQPTPTEKAETNANSTETPKA